MRPANRPQLFNLPPVRLFREDLDELVAMFQKHCKNVTISDEKFIYESVDEMAKNRRRSVGVFHLQGLIPHAEVWIKSKPIPQFNHSAVFTPDNSDPAQYLFLAVKDFLLVRRWRSKIVFLKASMSVWTVLFLLAALLKDSFRPKWHGASFVWDFGAIAIAALFVATAIKWTQSTSSIKLTLRSAQESFWRRNSDKLLLVIISALVGALITAAVTWITLHYINPPQTFIPK